MAPAGRRTGPSSRALLGVAGVLAMFGPLLAVLVVGWMASLTLALAAGLIVSLLLTLALLAGGWRLLRQLEDRIARTPLESLSPPASLSSKERGEQDTTTQPPTSETRNPAPSRILLVEDDPVTQRIAARLLRQLGMQADVVADGQAALDAVAANEYALVLMDCQLPVMDGYAAASEIRRREAAQDEPARGAAARRLPIIALTASTLDADRQRALVAGMDEYLTKPLDGERLVALLARWGLRHEVHRELPSKTCPDRPPILDPAGLPIVDGRLSEPYREIVQLYRQEAVRRMESLSAAAALPDRAQAARIAHTLAGSSSSIGALRMAAACAVLEGLAKNPVRAPTSPSAATHSSAATHPSVAQRAGGQQADDDGALAEAVEEVRRELHQLEAALADLAGE